LDIPLRPNIPLRHNDHGSAGIAIGPILFIVAILAILATAIAASSSTFAGNTTAEKARIYAATLMEQGSTMRSAVSRVTGLGCRDTQLSFENSVDASYANGGAPPDKHCNVFEVAGGGMLWIEPPRDLTTNAYRYASGDYHIGIGTGETELAMYLSFNDRAVCDHINKMVGIDSVGVDLAKDGVFGTFTGTYPNINGWPDNGGTNAAAFYGKLQGCVEDYNTPGLYIFYSVLLPR
jgi:type II secretory pathway pseudopilin PulG